MNSLPVSFSSLYSMLCTIRHFNDLMKDNALRNAVAISKTQLHNFGLFRVYEFPRLSTSNAAVSYVLYVSPEGELALEESTDWSPNAPKVSGIRAYMSAVESGKAFCYSLEEFKEAGITYTDSISQILFDWRNAAPDVSSFIKLGLFTISNSYEELILSRLAEAIEANLKSNIFGNLLSELSNKYSDVDSEGFLKQLLGLSPFTCEEPLALRISYSRAFANNGRGLSLLLLPKDTNLEQGMICFSKDIAYDSSLHLYKLPQKFTSKSLRMLVGVD